MRTRLKAETFILRTDLEIKRFLELIEVDPETECWIFQGTTHNGYGRFYLRGKDLPAHRTSYVNWGREEFDPNMVIDHYLLNEDRTACSTKCVNPQHLEQVTNAENQRRSPLVRAHRNTYYSYGVSSKHSPHPLFEGVYWCGRKFRASIKDPKTKKTVQLGIFDKSNQASQAYYQAQLRIIFGFSPK